MGEVKQRRHAGGMPKKAINEDYPSVNPMGGEMQPASKYVEARRWLQQRGFPRLAADIAHARGGGVRRPARALTESEAVAMMACWATVYGESYLAKLRVKGRALEMAELTRRLP